MTAALQPASFICRRCLAASRPFGRINALRYTTKGADPSKPRSEGGAKGEKNVTKEKNPAREPETGAMTQRLQEATDEALLSGGSAGKRAVEEFGFSEELKEKLLDRIGDARFRKQYAGAIAEASLPTSAGEGTRHMASSPAWIGEEQTPDAVLRC